MDRRRAAGALLALAACVACSSAAPTASNQTALELLEGPTEGCYYNFQHYGEGDRIMTNEPCLNCTCHNRMLMCYLKVCPFTKPIGQDCTIEKRADQCCPIVTCPDVPVDLLTTSSTSSPAEYGATGLGKVDKYGCNINGKYFPEGSKVPPTPNKPCEHCYCIRNMTTCVMQECTLHVDGCTPIYHKDVCCPVRYSCDHQEDEMLLLDDMTTTVRPTPGFLLTTTTAAVTQVTQDCVHDDQIFADGALIKTEKACEHCYCMKGDIVCVVQECGTPMENEGKNCTSLPPRQGQCCPDTYICEGDEIISDVTTGTTYEDLTTLSPPRRAEGSGYRNEPDEPYTEMSTFEGSGEEEATTLDTSEMYTSQKQTPEIIDEIFAATEESLKPSLSTIEPDKGQNTVPDDSEESTPSIYLENKTTKVQEAVTATQASVTEGTKETGTTDLKATVSDYHHSTEAESTLPLDDELIMTTESGHGTKIEDTKFTEGEPEIEKEITTKSFDDIPEITTSHVYVEPSSSEPSTLYNQDDKYTTLQSSDTYEPHELPVSKGTTTEIPKEDNGEDEINKDKQEYDSTIASTAKEDEETTATFTTVKTETFDTTSVNPVENEIDEDAPPPGRIPGEGDCLLNGITYKNNTNVPNINNCHSSCICLSSIVKCDPIVCSPPPENINNMNDCQPIYDTPDACCPTYVCHSRETMPPESHNQMSGTESPKLPSEKHESQCHGDECQSHGTAPELCNSKDCQTQEQEKDSNNSTPLIYPEPCIGDNCFNVEQTCIGENCHQQTPAEHICNSENGCQPSEAEPCEGKDCVSGVLMPLDTKPICHDSDGCKADSETPKPPCEGNSECDSTVVNKNTIETECTEENCRRKDQSQDEQLSPSECKGSDCEQPHRDGTNDFTTETSVKSESSDEPTTDKIITDISEAPDHVEPVTDRETQKVTPVDITTTEKHDASEHSTEKYSDLTTLEFDEGAPTQEPFTEPAETHATKLESSVTETKNESEYEKSPTVVPDLHITVSEEQATQSIEQITKEISTESPLPKPNIEYSTELPTENTITTERFTEPTKPLVTSTEISYIASQDKEKEHEKHGVHTDTPEISVTTSKAPDTEEGGSEEYTKEQEIITKSPEPHTTYLESESEEDNKITKSEVATAITESSITTTNPEVTQKHEDYTVKEDDAMKTVINEITEIPELTTDKSIPVDQSSESTKLEEPVTTQSYSDTHTEEIPVENPKIDNLPLEITSHDILIHTSTEAVDIGVEYSQSPSSDGTISDTVSDKEIVFTTPVETQEYVTSSDTLQDHATKSSAVEQNIETQTQENLATEEGMTNLPQFEKESPTTVTSQEFNFKESSTESPETITTVGEIKTPSGEDTYEVSTKKSDESYQEVTTQKLTAGTESESILKTEEQDSTSELMPQTSVSEFETTMPADQSHKDQETTIKYTESEPSKKYNDEITTTPKIIVSKSDETTPLTEEVENETTEVLSTRRVGENTVVATTESIKKPETEEPYKIPVSSEPATEPNLIEETAEMTIIPEIQSSEKEGMPTASVDHKTDETPSVTKLDTDETEKQSPVEQDTLMLEDRVTERINSDVSEDADKEIYKPTEYSDSQETKAEDGFTIIPALITQSHESETKLVSELQTEISITPTDIIKQDKEHTESPMILVTETEEAQTLKLEDYASHVKLDTTTQAPSKEDVEVSTQDAHEEEPHKSTTISSQTTLYEKEYDANTASSDYPQKVSIAESSSITPFEYTTTNIEDAHKEDVTSSSLAEDDKFVTETAEKLAPTTKLQENTTPIPIHVIPESEMHLPDIMHESTTTLTEKEETPTKSPDIFAPEPNITSNQESDLKHTDYPHDNADVQLTTTKTVDEKVTNDEGTQEHVTVFATPAVDEYEHTEIPEFSTAKYVETSDSGQDKITEEAKPSKEEEGTSAHDEFVTTERHIYTDPPINPEYHSTEILNQERSTNLPQTIDTEIKLSTPVYSSTTTFKESELPEISLSTASVLSTESSVIHEDDHRRTSAPGEENIQTEPSTTEKEQVPVTEQKTTEQPEATKTQFEDSDSTPEISTIASVKDTVTLAPTSQEPETEHDKLLPQTTDGDLIPTESIGYHEDHDASVTKSVEKDIAEFTTEKQIYTEQGEIQEVQTDSPTKGVTTKDEEIEKTTASEDLIQVPIETIPEKVPTVETVPQESETESVPQGTKVSVPLETATEVSISLETETETVPKEKYTTIPKDSETTVPIQTEATVLFDSATETSLSKQTEIDSPVPTKTDITVTEGPEISVSIKTETDISETETETEITVPKETDIISPELTESSVLKVTKESQTETPKHEIEPESTTYKNVPEEISSTTQPIYSSSETTPYLVELQEHTNKVDEDVSSVIPLDTYTTKSSEIYQTERGDQPLETVTDKSTIINEVQSEETITEKSEEVTAVPQEQPNEYPTSTSAHEEIPVKTVTEQATEVVSLPSESPVTTLPSTSSEGKIPTISTEEEIATPTPTISEASEDVKLTTVDLSIETSTGKKDLSPETERAPEQDTAQETTPIEEELLPAITKATTIKSPIETTTQYSSVHDKVTKPEDKPFEPYSPTTAPELPKPSAPEIQPTEEIPSPDFPPSGTSGYGQEPDYVEEDQAFGPGTCRYGGKVYVSAQQIPRDDPCDFCFCFRSDIICLQQSCPPPIQGCHEEPIQGFCCPRYECPVSMATTLNVTTTTTTTTTTLPPHFLPHAYKGAAQRRGCQIKGHTYKVGDVVRASSGPCLQCTCGGDGQMKCDPKACTPEPMLRQMIAAAVSAKRRR